VTAMTHRSRIAGRTGAMAGMLLTAIAVAGCATTLNADLTDATISARVKTALLRDPEMSGSMIEVETLGGIVTLSGRVGSRSIETRALRAALSVDGVTDVQSRLQVGR